MRLLRKDDQNRALPPAALGAGLVKQPLVCYAKVLHRFDNDVSTRQAKQAFWDAPGLWTDSRMDGLTVAAAVHYYAMLFQVRRRYQDTRYSSTLARLVFSRPAPRGDYNQSSYLTFQSPGAVTDGGPFIVCNA